MRRFLPYILSLVAALVCYSATAQSYTSFSRTVVSFESVPSGAQVFYRGECIGTTPCQVEVTAAYLLDCDSPDASSMSKNDIKAYNSAQMDSERNLSGANAGTFSKFSMVFEFVMDGKPHAREVAPLMWAPAKVMGMDGTKIYYQEEVRHSF